MLEYEGKQYARVSDVLRTFSDFSGISEEILQNKAAIGTRVHKAINEDIQGDLATVGSAEIGYFNSFHKWRIAIQPTFLETEKRYYCHEKMLTGCIDALIKIQGEDEAVLIDFKTSAQESPIVWPMQAHLYHYLITASGRKISSRFLFIKLSKNGALPQVFHYNLDGNIMTRCLQAVENFWSLATKM